MMAECSADTAAGSSTPVSIAADSTVLEKWPCEALKAYWGLSYSGLRKAACLMVARTINPSLGDPTFNTKVSTKETCLGHPFQHIATP